MITLYIVPKFRNFKFKIAEAGTYRVILPLSTPDPIISTQKDYVIVWEMWCSTMQWAIQDANCYCNEFMDDLFGKDNWQFAFVHNLEKIQGGDLGRGNIGLNMRELDSKRRRMHLPPWEEDKPDLFKDCFKPRSPLDFL